MNNKIDLKVYLKSKKRPIIFTFDSDAKVDEFYRTVLTSDIIKFGPVIFERSEFKYAVIISK